MKRAVLSVFLTVFVCLCGCDSNLLESVSDDSSSAAQIESARMALDNGNYQEAIDILEPGYDPAGPDPEAVRILASAYMGKAGIDLTYVLENSDESDGDSFNTIASALSLDITGQALQESAEEVGEEAAPETARFITFESALYFLENLEQAQAYLDDLKDSYIDQALTPEQDDTVQLGMASAVHFIVQIGIAAAGVTGSNVPVNNYAYREILPDDVNLDSLLMDLTADINASVICSSLREDLANVSAAVDVLVEVLGVDEDIAGEFSDFLADLLDGGPLENFSGENAAGYISTELLGYN